MFSFVLAFICSLPLKNDTGSTKMYCTCTLHKDKVYQKSFHLCRNKYINSNTLKPPSSHIFKSLQIRQVYDVWNSTEWKWQQIPPQSHWEILCQLLENCPVSWGSAWQSFLPHRSASLSAGRWSNYQLGVWSKERKESKRRGKKKKEKVYSFTRLLISKLLADPYEASSFSPGEKSHTSRNDFQTQLEWQCF